MDATHVIANIAIPGTIDLLRQGIKDVMKAIQVIDPDLYEELGGEKTANDDKKVYKLSPEERESKLVELVKKAREINQKSECIGGKVSEKTQQLKRILNENIEENETKIVKKKEKTADRLVSIVDKDARHGAKSLSEKSVMHVQKLQLIYNIRVSFPFVNITYCESYSRSQHFSDRL